MKRNMAVGFLALCAVLALLAGCGGSGGAKKAKYEWKMALNSTAGDNGYDTGAAFASKLEELTKGKVKITLYGGAALGTTREVLEGMASGVANVMVESVGTLAPFNKLANIDAFPYLYDSYDHFMAVWGSELGKEIKDKVGAAAGYKLLGGTFRGPRIVTATKDMRTVADFKGFKLRAPNLDVYLKTWQWMGASPIPMAIGEVYTALQQGTVNGQENPMADSLNFAFNEVCKYWIKTNHVYSSNVVIMDLKYYDSLPADIQKAIQEAAAFASKEVGELQLKKMEEAEKTLLEKGNTVIEVDTAAFAEHFKDFASTTYPDVPEFADWAKRISEMKK